MTRPEAGAGEAVIRITLTTICGTDLHIVRGEAQANLARVPDGVSDEQVVLLADIASTGISGAESAPVRIGDAVVVYAQGGGKARMRRLIGLVQGGRFDPLPLITHRFALADVGEAYALFGERCDGVLKVALTP